MRSRPRAQNQCTCPALNQATLIPTSITPCIIEVDFRGKCYFLAFGNLHDKETGSLERSYAFELVCDFKVGGIVAIERYGAVLRNGKFVAW